MKKIIYLFLIGILAVVAIVMFNTFTFESKQMAVNNAASSTLQASLRTVATDNPAKRLAEAVRFKTISYENPADFQGQPFLDFHAFLDSTYALVAQNLQKEIVADYSLLYRWEGTNPALKPVVLLGHIDVVPVEKESAAQWKADPFGGEIIDEYIWGRGTLDDKVTVIGIMEAIERLLATGFQPERTIYLAFGHDEEIESVGAKSMAALLADRGVEAEFVLDEGGVITQGVVPGISRDVALIGTAEKGYMSIALKVNKNGGHSSMPESETVIDILSQAIVKLKENPLPARITKPVQDFFAYLGPEMPFTNKMAMANQWLFENMIIDIYEKAPSSNASVKTTFVPTIFNSGVKANLIPSQATATVNFRILPGDSPEQILEHVHNVLKDMPVEVDIYENPEKATEPSPTDNAAFKMIHKSIEEVYAEALVAPYLMVGGTDARYYQGVSKNIYRFLPVRANSEDLKRIHGLNERISVKEFQQAIDFYSQLIKNSSIQDQEQTQI
jgi:carboxypeptidase PM20D1